MKTITLKTNEVFFTQVDIMAKELKLSKSEFIRKAVVFYGKNIKKQRIKQQIQSASFLTRESDDGLGDFEHTINDGLKNA